nr:MAG TPA: Lipopolysaccharide assembly protein A domain [Caudoviricetes sp.]
MFLFGILIGFFSVCAALDPNRLRKKQLKKSKN